MVIRGKSGPVVPTGETGYILGIELTETEVEDLQAGNVPARVMLAAYEMLGWKRGEMPKCRSEIFSAVSASTKRNG